MRYQLLVGPTEEPITVARAKDHLEIDADYTGKDALIGGLIIAARQYAENECQRALCTQQWRAVADVFSYPEMLIEKGGVQSVQSIKYLDMASVQQTVSTTEWVAELAADPARIAPRFGKIWPVALPQVGAVQIDFTAGYGAASDVPEGIKQWMLVRLASMFENREELIVLNRGSVTPLPYIDRLLDPYRLVLQ